MKNRPTDLLASRGAQWTGLAVAGLAALQAFGAIDPATVGDGSGWLSTALSTGLDRLGAGGTGALGGLALFANRLAARLKMRGDQLDDVLEYTRATADTLAMMRLDLDRATGRNILAPLDVAGSTKGEVAELEAKWIDLAEEIEEHGKRLGDLEERAVALESRAELGGTD